MQLMHAEAARSGMRFEWVHFLSPLPELLARFESAVQQHEPDWKIIEPNHAL